MPCQAETIDWLRENEDSVGCNGLHMSLHCFREQSMKPVRSSSQDGGVRATTEALSPDPDTLVYEHRSVGFPGSSEHC